MVVIEGMTKTKPTQQFTLEEINELLQSLSSTEPQKILRVVKTILTSFAEHLKTRPFGAEEANELFKVYLRIRYWSKITDPNNEEQEYYKEWIAIQVKVASLFEHEWLKDMFECYRETREYLEINGVSKKGNPVELEEIIWYLKKGDYFIEEENGRWYVHLDEEGYNEYGLEINEQYYHS